MAYCGTFPAATANTIMHHIRKGELQCDIHMTFIKWHCFIVQMVLCESLKAKSIWFKIVKIITVLCLLITIISSFSLYSSVTQDYLHCQSGKGPYPLGRGLLFIIRCQDPDKQQAKLERECGGSVVVVVSKEDSGKHGEREEVQRDDKGGI